MRGCEAVRWQVAQRNLPAETEIAQALGVSPLLVAMVRNRGLETAAEIAAFLTPSLENLHDPLLLPDLEPALERLSAAIDARETVLVHGDYDADGLTGAALLCKVLSRFGCGVQHHIPDRVDAGYGLDAEAVRLAAEQGTRLLVAVDCGVSDHAAIAQARECGMDVVVIDHHEPGAELPTGAWIVDPKRADSQYPERDLAGVGLAFKVASGLCQRRGVAEASLQRTFLDLVAVGTIADVVPLTGENRILVAAGLQCLAQTRTAGLRALLDICGIGAPVRTSEVAFRLAPRLNAVGRVGDASDGLELLLTDDPARARRLALHLDEMNRERQREQELAYQDALRMVDEEVNLDEDRVIVLASPYWHVGVVGIVASKILERFNRPAIMLVEEKEQLRGSARSVNGFNMAAALGACSSVLLRYGGHALAAGLSLKPGDLDEFRARLNLVAAESLAAGELVAQVLVDAEVALGEIDAALVEELGRLEPCGNSNPEPLLLTRDVEVLECRTVGQAGKHLKLYLRQEGSCLEAIGFGLGSECEWVKSGDRLDVCYTPEFSEYQGERRLQLRLEALRPHQRR
jgi:single-stranded-DNA-specific exonuclease